MMEGGFIFGFQDEKMSGKCEYADGCPIAKNFEEQCLPLMLKRYCQGKYTRCHRYQLRQAGQSAPEYVMPWDGMTELDAGN